MNFTPLDNGRIEGFCLVCSAEVKSGKNGDYLDLTLGDADGTVNGKIWSYNPATHGDYKSGDLVKVRGVLKQYNNADQLSVERIRLADKLDNVKIEDYVRSSGYSSEEMFNAVLELAGTFSDRDFTALVTAVYNDRRAQLLYWPAALKMHHAFHGGLLLHTLSIVRAADKLCEVYPFLNRDLLLTGAMLHDIAKIEEFVVNDAGVCENYSVRGNLLGHISMGVINLERYAADLDFPEEKLLLLQHMILSHHGEPEFGSAIRPAFLEAEVLSELDLMDARLYEMREATEEINNGEFSRPIFALGNRKLYRHELTDYNKKTNIL